jgi:hypothetical protein
MIGLGMEALLFTRGSVAIYRTYMEPCPFGYVPLDKLEKFSGTFQAVTEKHPTRPLSAVAFLAVSKTYSLSLAGLAV